MFGASAGVFHAVDVAALVVVLSMSACMSNGDSWKDGVEMLPNGVKVQRSTSPSGKRIVRNAGANDESLSEAHFYSGMHGNAILQIRMSFDHGHKTSEFYSQNGHPISREAYERARSRYSDMPPGDVTVLDKSSEALRSLADLKVQLEQKEKRRASMSPAEQLDDQCQEAMAKAPSQDLGEWRRTGRALSLGELDQKTSNAMINDLFAAGAVRIVATKVAKDSKGGLDTNWIVAEIPSDTSARRRLFAIFDRLADKDGWDPTPDVGQHYQLLGKFKWPPWSRWP